MKFFNIYNIIDRDEFFIISLSAKKIYMYIKNNQLTNRPLIRSFFLDHYHHHHRSSKLLKTNFLCIFSEALSAHM